MLGFLSNKDKLIEIGKLLGVESQTCNDIPNNCCNVADSKMKGRQLMLVKHIFKAFSDKITYLICPDRPTFHKDNCVQGTKVYQSLKENLSNLTFGGRKETAVIAARIIAK